MKIKVLTTFEDCITKKWYKSGETIEVSDSRGAELIKKNVAEEVKAKKKDDN